MVHSKNAIILRAFLYTIFFLLVSCNNIKTDYNPKVNLVRKRPQTLDSIRQNHNYTFSQLRYSLTNAQDSLSYYTLLNTYA